MQENTNKAIFINSIVLYSRLFVTMICGLFATRFALQALGAMDYGLFAVVGSIISFISIINTILVSTSNRFLAVAIGNGNEEDSNQQFNVNQIIHAGMALVIFITAIPIGHWYIDNCLNYGGNINNVYQVYDLTIIGSAISILGVPYNGLLMAKERFIVFSITDIIAHIILLIVSYLLLFHFQDKLTIYAIARTFNAIFPVIIYVLYCRVRFPQITKFTWVKNRKLYQDMFSFSIWVGYGALASVGKTQGATIIVNSFFNTIMNTAMGLANSVNHIIVNIAQNVSKSISPQITKSYAGGNVERSMQLVCMSSRYSFLIMLMVASPFLIIPDYILGLWLGEIPEYTVTFTVLMVIDALIGTLNAGIPELIFATGRIKWYQLIVNTIFLISVIVAYFVLQAGYEAYYLQIIYIIFSLIVLIIRQIVLNKVVKVDNIQLLRTSYLPSFIVLLLFIPCCFFPLVLPPLLQFSICFVYLTTLVLVIGLQREEKEKLMAFVRNKIKKS